MALLTRREAVSGVAALAAAGAAAAAEPVRIGLLLDMTGPLALTSEDIASGFALALDAAGREAGGRPLKIVLEDSAGNPARAAERFAKLVQGEGVDIVVGPTGSPEALVLRDLAHAQGVPLVIPNAGATALTGEKCSPFVLRVSYSHEQVVAPLATWMVRNGIARNA